VSLEVLMAGESTVADTALEGLLSASPRHGRHCRVGRNVRKVSTTVDQWNRASSPGTCHATATRPSGIEGYLAIAAIKGQKGRNEPDSLRPDTTLSCHAMIGRKRKLGHKRDKTQISPHARKALLFVLSYVQRYLRYHHIPLAEKPLTTFHHKVDWATRSW
jgi:hypothetical protein